MFRPPGWTPGVWGGWLSKKAFKKESAMHRLTFDPGQRRVLLLIFSRNGPIFSKAACKTRRMISSRRLTCSLKVIGMCSENSFSTSGSGFVQSVL